MNFLSGQTFELADLGLVALLVVLEGVLSIDNALVLGLLAKRLPKHQQARALTYGIVGAFVFRIIAIATASMLLKWRIVKLIGGGYLAYIAIRHLFFEAREKVVGEVSVDVEGQPALVNLETGEPLTPEEEEMELKERLPVPLPEETTAPPVRGGVARFWPTVLVIELTDIAFAVDSILAAIALVGSHPSGQHGAGTNAKLWVVIAGGILGIIMMRFAAVIFIRLLERFPRFESAAYLLVIVIGGKLLADWGLNVPGEPPVLDFHDWRHSAFWVFWGLMLLCFCVGFLPYRKGQATTATDATDRPG